ncbi:MAG: SCO1664 family protein, partial [Acidimicrobiia bacterium]
MSTGASDPDAGEHDRAVVSEERARAFLAEGELELLGRIPWASNATVLAKVTHEGLEGLAVYKPARGERPLWDFPNGTLYRREVAAYLVSEQLGWRLVPPTLARDGPLGVGSVQLYVDADPEVTAFELLADGNPSMARIAAFDVVTNNADRKAGHCLAGQDGHV